MTFSSRETSRTQGQPTNLYLFKGADPTLESMLRSVTIIPGTTEFGYGTTRVTKDGVSVNGYANLPVTDFQAALDDLVATATDLTHVSLVVAWHGSDLRCSNCVIRPKVETAVAATTPYQWRVADAVRSNSPVVSQIGGKPAIGGAPADRSIYEAILAIKAKGLKVTLYPFVMMDIASGNALPNPYGGSSQPSYPWRGRITCHPAPGRSGTVDKTATATAQVNTFFGNCAWTDFSWDHVNLNVAYGGPTEWSYRRFILHMAMLASAAGVDDFLIGSEMVGLTTVRGTGNSFPAVTKLVELAGHVRNRLGPSVKISYAADWSEYHSYRPTDGSGDVFFHLDPLWSASAISYVGIDNYMPMSDWRDGDLHADRVAGHLSGYAQTYLKSNIEGGEYYGWYYASQAARNAQTRSPIEDGSYNEPWVYRQKDIRNWWGNRHFNRLGGVRSTSATAWAAQSKPIVFTEVGCPAVNRGANQPNVFVDAKSSESGLPYYSNGIEDAAMQRAFLEATLSYWHPRAGKNPTSTVYGRPMVDWSHISVWTWDARPFPAFPEASSVWGDTANWSRGHWINGRIHAGRDFDAGDLGPYAYTNGESPVTKDGIVFLPIPVSHANITASGSLDKSTLEISMAQGQEVGDLYIAYPPSQVINLIIYQGHAGDDPDLPYNYPVAWTGRVLGVQHPPNETKFTCEPISTSIRRPGLRRNYQVTCPHVLYGDQCKANRRRATRRVVVRAIGASTVTLAPGWAGSHPQASYAGGMISWQINGSLEARGILRVDGDVIRLPAGVRNLAVGDSIDIALGCAHNMADCRNLHSNIANFGGQPYIPYTNPIGMKVNFY